MPANWTFLNAVDNFCESKFDNVVFGNNIEGKNVYFSTEQWTVPSQ